MVKVQRRKLNKVRKSRLPSKSVSSLILCLNHFPFIVKGSFEEIKITLLVLLSILVLLEGLNGAQIESVIE